MPGTWAPEGYKGADRKMFGECHAHIIMDGKNYKAAVSLHRNGPAEGPIRQHLEAWQQAGVTFVRDGGDALGVSARARELAPEYGIDYRTPVFAIHKKGHYGGIVGHAFEDRKEYRELVERAKREGADFIKIMISGIMEFDQFGVLNEEGLSGEEIREMMNHINSYPRKKWNGQAPIDLFVKIYGQEAAERLGLEKIPSDSIHLTPALFKK